MTSLSETYIQKIKRASATPQKLDFLISQLGLDSDPDSTCKDLLNRMDDSDYGITDWIDAIYATGDVRSSGLLNAECEYCSRQ